MHPQASVRRRAPAILALGLAAGLLSTGAAPSRETLHPIGALPPALARLARGALAFQRVRDGSFYVFDPRDHAVYHIDAAMRAATQVVRVGAEAGHLLQPTAFASEPDGTFAVADAPTQERIQVFASDGTRIGGFFPPGRSRFQVILDGLVIGGVGSMQYNGRAVLVSEPATGALATEYSPDGGPIRAFGRLRDTDQPDPAVRTLLNTGLPLFVPGGGYDYVFQTGTPLFRKYDRTGRLLFERHIEGREIDPLVAQLPTEWPPRPAGSTEIPVTDPIVRAAAVDPAGNLWVALAVPYLYVYDPEGDKIRVVQLETPAGPLVATSLFFDGRGRLLVTPGCNIFDPK
ncbi:MAG TPA: hypothetical protein VNE16_05815 [Vicinamibacterales bacterium]|nr:hypothetical protein [Vicinamibacterales bacterium]